MNLTFFNTTLKRGFFLLSLAMALSFTAQAQRIAVVDVNKILESIDEYQAAQQELDQIASKWRQDIAQEYDKIKGMYNSYQAEQVLLSDEARRQREEEIMAKEKEVRDLQKTYFGPEGQLFKRRQDLVRPIQDKVYAAIESYAQDRGYDLVLDKSSASGILFNNPDYDKTEDIMNRLK
jgi:outer membrane protein